jgi:uncharacterized membrane protein
LRERAVQTVAYELGGLLVVSPLWAALTGSSAAESVVLLVALSLAVMCWTAIYNTVFDLIEARMAGRLASDRPQRWRVVHAVCLEFTTVLVTTPLIVVVAGFGWLEALVADIGLGLAYVAYGYVFFLGFDRLRPLRRRT